MDINNINLSQNKKYSRYKIAEDQSIFRGYYEEDSISYTVDVSIRVRLAKDLGFSYDLYTTLSNIDEFAADAMVKSMSNYSKHTEIILLLDSTSHEVLGYALDSERLPILNDEFVHRIIGLSETSQEIEIAEYYYHPDSLVSHMIIRKKSPIVIEEKYENRDSNLVDYDVGILLTNDELSTASSRLVLYVGGQPLYLPSSYYNATATRYRRSTSSSLEALEVLMLKVIDDLREDTLTSKLYDFHFRYRANKQILATYEEYQSILRTMRKIPTIIEDNGCLESLASESSYFEKKYVKLEDQRSSYIWRCTATSDVSVGSLVDISAKILSDLNAPAIEYADIRDLLGSYISTKRIVEEIAEE